MRATAVIVAAGAGRRCDGDRPKQFRALGEKRVLEWACGPFRRCELVHEVIVVVPPEVSAAAPAWLSACADCVVEGGSSRRESAGRGVAASDPASDVILIHDAARPFVSLSLVERVAQEALAGPVVPLVPVTDTIKRADAAGSVLETVHRADLGHTQTPQGFPAQLIRRIHAAAAEAGADASDDALLCERAGVRVRSTQGDPCNLKLTTELDLLFASWLVTSGSLPPR